MMYTQQNYGQVPPPGHALPPSHAPPPPAHAVYGPPSDGGVPMGYFGSVRGSPIPGHPVPQMNQYGPPPSGRVPFDMGSVRAPTTAAGSVSGFDRDRDGYRDGAVGYRCRFLGSELMGVAEPQPSKVGEVVDRLIKFYKDSEVQPRRYLIRVRTHILELEELENDEVHIQNVPLDAITFCASDNRYKRLFTFVARAESGYVCHVFYCREDVDVDNLTRDFDDAFRNCYAEWQGSKHGTVTSVTAAGALPGITDPAVAQAVETALAPRQSRYRANVQEIVVEEQPRSLPLYNFEGQRVKSIRSRATTTGEPSSTRYIFAYEDDDDDDETTVQVRRGRKSHRYPVAKEQFRFNSERGSGNTREYKRQYVVESKQPVRYTPEQQLAGRREYALTQPATQTTVRSASAAPASYRTEFVAETRAHSDVVEAGGRAYNMDFFEPGTRPVVIETTQPIPAADGPAVIVEERDVGYGRREYGSVRGSQVVDGGVPHPSYGLHAASNDRSDMLY